MSFFKRRAKANGFEMKKQSAAGYPAALPGCLGPEYPLGETEELQCCNTRPDAVMFYCPVTSLLKENRGISKFSGNVRDLEFPESVKTKL